VKGKVAAPLGPAPPAPSKPSKAYNLFSSDKRAQVKLANPNATAAELMKLIGAKWNAAPEEEKKKYNDKASELKVWWLVIVLFILTLKKNLGSVHQGHGCVAQEVSWSRQTAGQGFGRQEGSQQEEEGCKESVKRSQLCHKSDRSRSENKSNKDNCNCKCNCGEETRATR
jgi:hypothetical protein